MTIATTRKSGGRSLLRRAFRILRAKDLRRPVQKRLRWQAIAPMVVVAAAGILGVAMLLVGSQFWWWDVYSVYIAVTAMLLRSGPASFASFRPTAVVSGPGHWVLVCDHISCHPGGRPRRLVDPAGGRRTSGWRRKT